ncbi:CDP-diacylglycerol--serine O-phosphatidyltransferase [Methyloceanibacter sp.]|uniref:CDP-diacylglycerol--serine O-phosphatidyltransferase n=1 Tax=Methyloceanibacter sp. TaxID=1965321 RepID=UPI00208AA78D|nr:CDP-diacylglycerol--serine O-phosphatidyltransferase [Methyloceanibacter sp.]GFO81289.1 MAG: CDP-diacylglycerol--serine O-phosphatidyltransferase [Methyloceanibacter sp.]HML91830.1 CDP-diacylglycerol--serine O-phosphatidyltransferase [Methyloceanibacter sp.]
MFPPFDPERDDRKRRPRVFARGQVPIRVLVPNIFTLVGLCAGLTAIRMGIEHRWDMAVAALVFAAFLDGIDGHVARLLKASTRFGAELDSLADFVNFGVAPAIVIFIWSLEDLKSLGWIAVLVFAVCSALRLARFNVSLDQTDQPAWKKSFFVGVPAPAGALILLLPIYAQDLGLHWPSLTPLVLLYTVAIALLMVSNVPTISIKMLGQRIHREYVPPLFVLAALFMALLLTYPAHTLFLGSLVYLASIPVSAYRYVLAKRRADEHAKAQNGAGASNDGSARQAGPERHV